MNHNQIEITGFSKSGGPLTKRIMLGPDGSLRSDGSACVMSAGSARRLRFDTLDSFAAHIAALYPNEAIALGALRDELPEEVEITTKNRLAAANGVAPPNVIARTCGHILYRPDQPTLALIDFDTKGMPPPVQAIVDKFGGFLPALMSVLPAIATAGRVARASTSSGIVRTDTGQAMAGSNGMHLFLLVYDGNDVERFLKSLHARCWLHGFGWMMLGAGGQLLERSIVDRMVGAPERLVFEGPPVLIPPIAQDVARRTPVVAEGEVLDTIIACPPLTLVEQAKLRELVARERRRLAEDAKKARAVFIAQHAAALAQRAGMTAARANQIIEKQCDGALLPDVVLPFDDPDLAGCTVGEVLADPERFEGATLADPLEGVDYGTCKARIMRRDDGSLFIHSFAHGRAVYELRLDAAAARKAVEDASKEEVAQVYRCVLLTAEMSEDEVTELRRLAAERGGLDRNDLRRMEKAARQRQREQRAEGARNQRLVDRTDLRPSLDVPPADAEWLPVMNTLNEVLGASQQSEPPMRGPDGAITAVLSRRIPGMHLLTPSSANEGELPESRLPSPEQALLTRLSAPQVAELIEQYIEYIDTDGRPVHLPTAFVAHYVNRPNDTALPIVSAIATLPVVLANGTILSGGGLNRQHGIVFRVPKEIEALLLYTILLRNPQLRRDGQVQLPKTRFKAWWHTVGSAVEHAAGLCGIDLDFAQLFLSQETDDEESASLGEALDALSVKWPGGIMFTAHDLAKLVNERNAEWRSPADRELGEMLREILFPNRRPDHVASAKAVGRRLRDHVGNPVVHNDTTLVLSRSQDTRANGTNATYSYAVAQSKQH